MAQVKVDAQRDLMPLRSVACRTIRAELRKANLSRSHDVEDLFQDACVIVVMVSRKGRKINKIKAFLLRVCRNLARHYMRRIIRMERVQERFPRDLVRAAHGEASLELEPPPEARPLVLEALPRLRARDRRIIEMMFIEQLSDEEMRKELTIRRLRLVDSSGEYTEDTEYTPGALRTAKHRALRALLREIQEIVKP